MDGAAEKVAKAADEVYFAIKDNSEIMKEVKRDDISAAIIDRAAFKELKPNAPVLAFSANAETFKKIKEETEKK